MFSHWRSGCVGVCMTVCVRNSSASSADLLNVLVLYSLHAICAVLIWQYSTCKYTLNDRMYLKDRMYVCVLGVGLLGPAQVWWAGVFPTGTGGPQSRWCCQSRTCSGTKKCVQPIWYIFRYVVTTFSVLKHKHTSSSAQSVTSRPVCALLAC